ncbi:hypothetical protein ACIGXD_40005, partial [Streptomyces gardneri]
MAAAAAIVPDVEPEFEFSSHEAFVSYLDSAEGQQPLREEGLSKAEITAVYAGDDVAAKGWLDKLKKKALKKELLPTWLCWQRVGRICGTLKLLVDGFLTKIARSHQELRVLVHPSSIDLNSRTLRCLTGHLAVRRREI